MNLPNKLTLTRIILVPVFMVFVSLTQIGTEDFNPTWYLVAGITVASLSAEKHVCMWQSLFIIILFRLQVHILRHIIPLPAPVLLHGSARQMYRRFHLLPSVPQYTMLLYGYSGSLQRYVPAL